MSRGICRENNISVPLDRAVGECALCRALPQVLTVAAVAPDRPCQCTGRSSPQSKLSPGHVRIAQLLEPGLQPEPLAFSWPCMRPCASNRTMTAVEMWEIVISKADELSKMSRILQKGLELLKWGPRASSTVRSSAVLDAGSPSLWPFSSSFPKEAVALRLPVGFARFKTSASVSDAVRGEESRGPG